MARRGEDSLEELNSTGISRLPNAGGAKEAEEVLEVLTEEHREGGSDSVRSFWEDPACVDAGVATLKDEVCKRL